MILTRTFVKPGDQVQNLSMLVRPIVIAVIYKIKNKNMFMFQCFSQRTFFFKLNNFNVIPKICYSNIFIS